MKRPHAPGILRHREDARSIAFVALYALLASSGYLFFPLGAGVVVPLIAITCTSSFLVAVITHNTIHSPVFHSRALNRAFQVWLSLSYGFPVSEFTPGHNLSHHRHTQKAADLMRTSKVRHRWNLLNLFAFMPAVGVAITRTNWEFARVMRNTKPVWYRQLVLETVLVWGVKIALVWLDWRRALCFVVIPHLFAVWGITTVNYLQHDGCDEDDPHNHSRNFVGRAFNWLTFNNGFHGIHHMIPGLHWSRLREAHEQRLHPHIHPALEQRSLALYLFRTFVLPGKRVTFDGKPYEPQAVEDVPYLTLEREPELELAARAR